MALPGAKGLSRQFAPTCISSEMFSDDYWVYTDEASAFNNLSKAEMRCQHRMLVLCSQKFTALTSFVVSARFLGGMQSTSAWDFALSPHLVPCQLGFSSACFPQKLWWIPAPLPHSQVPSELKLQSGQ